MRTRSDTLNGTGGLGRRFCRPSLPAWSAATQPDVQIRLTAAPSKTQIWEGAPTEGLRFTGEVTRGRSSAVRSSASYLGPTHDFVRGERVRIRFRNRIGDPSIVHWHGTLVPEEADGHPRHAVASGREYVYDFVVRNPTGTCPYHPHPHGQTGPQVYRGLSGLLIVREPIEQKRDLPMTEQELSMVIQDRRVGDDNQLAYSRRMMAQMTGMLGDTVLVNGQPDAAFAVTLGPWRLRIANVSNARIYKLAWSDGLPMRIIATDNGLVSAEEGPVERPYIVLAPFERVEILEYFGSRRPEAEIAFESRAFSSLSRGGMMGSMMDRDRGGMMQRMRERSVGGMMDGILGPIREMLERVLPQRMAVADGWMAPGMGSMMERMMGGGMGGMRGAAAQGQPCVSSASASHADRAILHANWCYPKLHRRRKESRCRDLLAARLPPHTRLLQWPRLRYVCSRGRRAVTGGPPNRVDVCHDGAGMAMAHPIHIHGVRFRMLERSGNAAPADLREGVVDAGFKDTFLIFPGERVRVHVVPRQPGLFMYHCHNLEHEDGGMMRNCSFDP